MEFISREQFSGSKTAALGFTPGAKVHSDYVRRTEDRTERLAGINVASWNALRYEINKVVAGMLPFTAAAWR